MNSFSKKQKNDYKEIYLAGGCFWGVEEYFSRIEGIIDVSAGYANGNTKSPTYYDVCHKNTGHAETIYIQYDNKKIDLETILIYFFRIIDPTSLNRQGNDQGIQYRTGIYYTDSDDLDIIRSFIVEEQKKYLQKIVVEVDELRNFYLAEDYHQNYLLKNPQGYCHIDFSKLNEPVLKNTRKISLKTSDIVVDKSLYQQPDEKIIKDKLSAEEYAVTQHSATEQPFKNKYWDNEEEGIYVDIVTKEPLFSSKDKYHSGSGWPSFTKPITPESVTYSPDHSLNSFRMEVKSSIGKNHLGHVFEDGPEDKGGKRYCINSAALEFIPIEKMEEKGYSYLLAYN